jgi:hypothetical protein
MSVPPRLSIKLKEAMGQDAADDLVTWLEDERSQREAMRSEMRADLAELRQEMRAGFETQGAQITAHVSALFTDQFRGLNAQIQKQFFEVETRLSDRIHAVDKRVADVKADLMKWSFVFWVGAVSAIAMLAGVLP